MGITHAEPAQSPQPDPEPSERQTDRQASERSICNRTFWSCPNPRQAVFAPEKNAGHCDWSCTIHCPALFSSDKKIAGVDADQALELAGRFVLDLFEHHGVRRAAED